MLQYEYLCLSCKRKFTVLLTIVEYEKGQIACPNCGNAKVEEQWTVLYAFGSKKS